MMLAHFYRNTEEEMRGEGKVTVHAKLMVKDVHRHTPARAELESIETQFTFKRTRSVHNYPLKRRGG